MLTGAHCGPFSESDESCSLPHILSIVASDSFHGLPVDLWWNFSVCNFHHWSSHLGLVYTDSSDFAIFGSTHWSLLALACLVPVVILLRSLQWIQNTALWTGVSFYGTHRNCRGPVEVSRQGGEWWSGYFLSGIPSQQARCVQVHCHGATTSLCSSTFQAICASHFPSVVSKPRSKKILIDSLTRWNKLLIHNSSNVKKNDKHWLDVAANLARFFQLRRERCLPLRRLLLCSWVIIVQPWFMTSYDPGQEVRIMSAFCSLVHTWTQWSNWSLFKRQGINFAAICLMYSSSARMCWHDSPMQLHTSWIGSLLG